MMTAVSTRPVILLLLIAFAAVGQRTFEIASVKPMPAGEAGPVSISNTKGRIAFINVTLKLLVSYAYNIAEERMSGTTGWMESARYEVLATLPPHTTREDELIMFQTLLAERFSLAVQRTTKMVSAYGLVIGKQGPKLKTAQPGNNGGNYIFAGRYVGTGVSTSVLAGVLSGRTGRPVVDQTGIKGDFDINLEWTPDNANVTETSTGPSIYTAVREQLGLDLVPQKAPIEFLVVEHANRTPIEN